MSQQHKTLWLQMRNRMAEQCNQQYDGQDQGQEPKTDISTKDGETSVSTIVAGYSGLFYNQQGNRNLNMKTVMNMDTR